MHRMHHFPPTIDVTSSGDTATGIITDAMWSISTCSASSKNTLISFKMDGSDECLGSGPSDSSPLTLQLTEHDDGTDGVGVSSGGTVCCGTPSLFTDRFVVDSEGTDCAAILGAASVSAEQQRFGRQQHMVSTNGAFQEYIKRTHSELMR